MLYVSSLATLMVAFHKDPSSHGSTG